MDRLILCEQCDHGVTGHTANGCEVPQCRCSASGELIINRALSLAMHDIHNQYRPTAPSIE